MMLRKDALESNVLEASVVITARDKSEDLVRTLESLKKSGLPTKSEIIVLAPKDMSSHYTASELRKLGQVSFIKDEGKGKSRALNIVLSKLKGKIWIFTEAGTELADGTLKNLLAPFKDSNVACVAGRPVSIGSRKNKIGFWSHLLYDAGAHRIREELSSKNAFIECSGYLFAFRNNITRNIPENVSDDSLIPYLVTKKGYKVKYAKQAIVYVSPPPALASFIRQKVNSAKGHEALEEYAPFFPKIKSLRNEIMKGTMAALSYPRSTKEFIWTLELFVVRLYIWARAKWETRVLKRPYKGERL